MGSINWSWSTDQAISAGQLNEMVSGINKNMDDIDNLSGRISGLTDALNEKINANGVYNEFIAGSSQQLLATEGVIDNSAYAQKIGQNASITGGRVKETLVGGSMVWNQLILPQQTSGAGYGISINISGTSWKVSGIATDVNNLTANNAIVGPITNGHIYITTVEPPIPDNVSGTKRFSFKSMGTNKIFRTKIWRAGASGNQVKPQFFSNSGDTWNMNSKVCTFDLTTMFGNEVAEQIFALEHPSGDINGADTDRTEKGIKLFKQLFPKSSYEYNAGELMSVQPSKKYVTGFNQWDEQWEPGSINEVTGAEFNPTNPTTMRSSYISVIPNARYYITVKSDPTHSIYARWYDQKKNFLFSNSLTALNDKSFIVPINAFYLRFVTGTTYGSVYKHDICINLFDETRNGDYEPYEGNIYEFDNTITLRGKYQIDNEKEIICCDGDMYTSEGIIAKKYIESTLGQMSPSFTVDTNVSNASGYVITVSDLVSGGNVISKKDITVRDQNLYFIQSSGESESDLKNTRVIYETMNPTVVSAQPFIGLQHCSPYGIEEYISASGVMIPPGHINEYLPDLRYKLEKLLDYPTASGNYKLVLSVNENGVPTCEWEQINT